MAATTSSAAREATGELTYRNVESNAAGFASASQARLVSPDTIEIVTVGAGPRTSTVGESLPNDTYLVTIDRDADEIVVPGGVDADTDGDGLPDCIETGGWQAGPLAQSSLPDNPDSDGDDLEDGEEAKLSTLAQLKPPIANYTVADFAADLGVPLDTNVRIVTPISDITEEDGDNQVDDIDEVAAGTNPFLRDSDFDNVNDIDELADPNRDPLVDERIRTLGLDRVLALESIQIATSGVDADRIARCSDLGGNFFFAEKEVSSTYGTIAEGTCARADAMCLGTGCTIGSIEYRRLRATIATVSLPISIASCDIGRESSGLAPCMIVFGLPDDATVDGLSEQFDIEVDPDVAVLVIERPTLEPVRNPPQPLPDQETRSSNGARNAARTLFVLAAVVTVGVTLYQYETVTVPEEDAEIDRIINETLTITIDTVNDVLNANQKEKLTPDEEREIEDYLERECSKQPEGRQNCLRLATGTVPIYFPGGTNVAARAGLRPMGASTLHTREVLVGERAVPGAQVWLPAFLERVPRSVRLDRETHVRPVPPCVGDLQPSTINCDEFPYNATAPALLPGTPLGLTSGIPLEQRVYVPSTQPAPERESGAQGTDLLQFFARCDVKLSRGDQFFVVPLPERYITLLGEVDFAAETYTPEGGAAQAFTSAPAIWGGPSFGVRFLGPVPVLCMFPSFEALPPLVEG